MKASQKLTQKERKTERERERKRKEDNAFYVEERVKIEIVVNMSIFTLFFV